MLPSVTQPPSDQPPDIPPVTTPDIKQLAQAGDAGHQSSGIAGYYLKVFWCSLVEGLKIVLTVLADVFDEVAALLTGFFTAAQGQDTPGFNNLVAAVLSDTLGIEVSPEQIASAQFEGGRVAAMNAVGADLFNTLGNEWITGTASSDPGAGIGGLPGTPGQPIDPTQGVKAAQSFIGFALSFAVRQGNVAFLSSALPWEWLGGIREYGEMMAKNLGLGRLTRQALKPFINALISVPLTEALNQQYRPHILDAKQLASAYIRGDIDRADYMARLARLGYTDADANVVIADSYSRLSVKDLMLLHETGNLSDTDLQKGLSILGFNTSDIPGLILSRQIEMIQGVQRGYVDAALSDVQHGRLDIATFNGDVDSTALPKMVKDWYKIRGSNRAAGHARLLSLGFLKKAYLIAAITLDEFLAGAAALGYSQDSIDMLEAELLVEQKDKAAAAAKKAAKKAPPPATPPTTPPTTTGG